MTNTRIIGSYNKSYKILLNPQNKKKVDEIKRITATTIRSFSPRSLKRPLPRCREKRKISSATGEKPLKNLPIYFVRNFIYKQN